MNQEHIKKKAQKVLDNQGNLPLAHLDALMELTDKITELKDSMPKTLAMEGVQKIEIKGDKGDTGEQGIQGEKGEQGLTGMKGEPGIKGKDGKNGKQGKDGRDGLDGLNGENGKDGMNGKDGSPDTRDQIIEKINSGKEKDIKIEATQIAGLPKFTREVIREVGAHGGAYETPIKNFTTGKLFPKDASGAYLITPGGGSGSEGLPTVLGIDNHTGASTIQSDDETVKVDILDGNVYNVWDELGFALDGPHFTGSGPDDLQVALPYRGNTVATYTVIVDAVDTQHIGFNTISGSLVIGNTYQQTGGIGNGAKGRYIGLDQYNEAVFDTISGGPFTQDGGAVLTNSGGSPYSANISQVSIVSDTFSCPELSFVLQPMSTPILGADVDIAFSGFTGHTLNDQWVFSFIVATTRAFASDGHTQTMGDVDNGNLYGTKITTRSDRGQLKLSGQTIDYLSIDVPNNLFMFTDFSGSSAFDIVSRTWYDLFSAPVIETATGVRLNSAYYMPFFDGSAGQSIVTDGAGNLSFSDIIGNLTINTANGFAGTSSGGLTPSITLSTTVTGILQGNGTTISAASTSGAGAIILQSGATIMGADLGSSTATTQAPATNNTTVATTAYVEAAIVGLSPIGACKYSTAAAFGYAVVYANGSSGVGATLTKQTNGALSVDGSTPSVGDRILVKNSVSSFQNGIYRVTVVGSGSVQWVMTRTTDYDTSAEILLGDSVFITNGSTLANTTWAQNAQDNPIIGTDPITFTQVAGQGSFTAGNGISITGVSIAIDTSVTVDKTTAQVLLNKDLTSGTNTFPTLNQNTTGSAAKWTTARNLAGNSVDGSANVAFANKFIVQGTTDAGLSAAQFLGALGTGIVKNTTTTGVLSIAIAADFPTLNQNTTGSAATLTTPRAINGTNFDGSAAITITAAAGTLTGTTLNSTVVTSSLTSHGTITSGGLGTGAVIGGVTMTLGSDANYDMYYRNSSGVLTRLANGTTGQVLTATTSNAPSWGIAGAGTVTNVSGTANRISVATGTTTPVIDIDAAYVGQASITTLGTITTGTWNASPVTGTYGGSGVNNGANTLTFTGTGTLVMGSNTLTVGGTSSINGTAATGSGASGRVALWGGTNTLTSLSTFTQTTNQIAWLTSNATNTSILVTNANVGAAAVAYLRSSNNAQNVSLQTYGTNYTTAGLLQAGLTSIESTSTVGLLHNIGSGGTYYWNVNSTSASIMSLSSTVLTMTGATIKPTAGTTTVLPVQFTSGTSVTSPLSGGMEYDGNKFWLTNSSLARESVVGALFTQTANKTVANTVTETSIVGTGVGYGLTLPVNFFVVGKTIRITMSGVYSTVAVTGDTVTVKVKYGSTVIATKATTSLLAGASNNAWFAEVLITCRTTGATGTVMTSGGVTYQVAGNAIVEDELNNGAATATIDTTAASLLDITVTHGAANASNTVTSLVSAWEIIN